MGNARRRHEREESLVAYLPSLMSGMNYCRAPKGIEHHNPHSRCADAQQLSRSLLPAAAATVSHPHRAGTAHSARRGRTAPARPRRTAHPCGHLFLFVRSPPFLRVHRSIKQSTVSWHPPALPSGFAAPGRKGCTLVQRTFAASCDRCIVFVTPTYIECANVCHRRITRALAVFV